MFDEEIWFNAVYLFARVWKHVGSRRKVTYTSKKITNVKYPASSTFDKTSWACRTLDLQNVLHGCCVTAQYCDGVTALWISTVMDTSWKIWFEYVKE